MDLGPPLPSAGERVGASRADLRLCIHASEACTVALSASFILPVKRRI